MLSRKVAETIHRYRLVEPGDRVLVAVSGGADSMALLQTLADLRQGLELELGVAHLDHQLRGDASRADAAFVEEQAKHLELPFHLEAADVRALAAEAGLSLEMAARRARYDFFRRVADGYGYRSVATGHTLNDQAETLLLRLARGAGGQGLSGIGRSVELQGLRVIRPLRDVRRDELTRYLRERGAGWREDASNRDLSFLRNRVRHEILPMIRDRLNPRADEALARAADLLEADEAWLEACLDEFEAEVCPADRPGEMDAARLAGLPLAAQRRLVRRWLVGQGVDPATLGFAALARVLSLAESHEGSARVPLPGGGTVKRAYATLSFLPGDTPPRCSFDEILRIPGETLIPEEGYRAVAHQGKGRRPVASRGTAGALPASASFSLNRCGGDAVHIRGWREGDRIVLAGSAGTKKVQDVFTDAKVAQFVRRSVPLLVCRDEVIWIPGYQVAGPWHVESPDALSVQVEIERT